jgi:YidC/Oxa1 family membrane protein insertase
MIDFLVQTLLALNKILFNNLGLTIIVLGILTRVAVWPLFRSQIKHTKAMAGLKPQLDEIKRKYKGDQRRQLEEQQKLFKSQGVNPVGGCLPMIVQFVVLILLYRVLLRLLRMDVNTQFFSWDLAKPDVFHVPQLPFALPGALVIFTALATFIQSKMIMPPAPSPVPSGKKGEQPDFSEALQASSNQMAYFTPLIMLYIGTVIASGLALYWLVSTVFGIIQQYQIGGLGGLRPWLKKLSPTK